MKIRDFIVGILLVLLVVFFVRKEFSSDNKEIILGDTVVAGDINNDGKVNAADYMLIRRHILNNPALTGTNLSKADLNKDGKVNALDYVLVRKIILGTAVTLPTNTQQTTPTIAPTERISINKTSLEIKVDEKVTLTATITPSSLADQDIIWKSSDTNIASVGGSSGVVRGVGEGTATITAKIRGKDIVASCTVTVKLGVFSVKTNTAEETVYIGQSRNIYINVESKKAPNREVTVTSSNPSVATVSIGKYENNPNSTSIGYATVNGLKEGTTTITIKSKDGGVTTTCKVNVVPLKVESVSISSTYGETEFEVGKSVQYSAIISPPNATNKSVTWKSSNPKVATVDSNGLVKGVGPGTVTITVTTADGNKTASMSLKIIRLLESVVIKDVKIGVGESVNLTYTKSPSDSNDDVSWGILWDEYATIDQNGRVTGKSPGLAVVKARSKKSNKFISSGGSVYVHEGRTTLKEFLMYSSTCIGSVKADNITKIVREKNQSNVPSSAQNCATYLSKDPVYTWYNNGTIYYYSPSSKIYLNENAQWYFKGMKNLQSIDLTGIDTSLVKDMSNMFSGDESLTSLDLRGFNTSNVTTMRNMFLGCKNLKSINLTSFNTSNVTDMSYMFAGTSSLTSLDVSKFNTSKVTNMSYMFNKCSSLKSIDVSKFDTSQVTNMSYMFAGSGLTSININNFKIKSGLNMQYMFKECTMEMIDLSGLDLTNAYKDSIGFVIYLPKGITASGYPNGKLTVLSPKIGSGQLLLSPSNLYKKGAQSGGTSVSGPLDAGTTLKSWYGWWK